MAVIVIRDCTYNDHMADMPAAELGVRGILHVDDPAGDEDAQPCQEKVLNLNGWETILWQGGRKGTEEEKKNDSEQRKKLNNGLCLTYCYIYHY